MKKALLCAAVALAAAALPATAADKVKVGLLTTLSGPGAGLGVDIRDGFALGLKHAGGKFGPLSVELITADDQQNPETTKQATDRFIKRDKIDLMTGIVFSNLMLAVGPTIFDAKRPYVSANAGPSQYAGEQCTRTWFSRHSSKSTSNSVRRSVQSKPFLAGALNMGPGILKTVRPAVGLISAANAIQRAMPPSSTVHTAIGRSRALVGKNPFHTLQA